ncbi:MAG: DUF2088 domain-containing protein [Armatimonadetes bacterium]|nr:DUF2088 domain-containing protein [Armatimonadota bacterium]
MPYPWPLLHEVRQEFARDEVADVAAAVGAGVRRLAAPAHARPGARVGITAGSRGIDRIDAVLSAVAEWVRAAGARPFILAAMGSHGGATEAGQRQVLAGYGITEERVGCPVETDTDVERVGETAEGIPVLCSRKACAADGLIVVNRVKPHTILTGDQGSGLMKMMAIGLGGPRGADAIHAGGLTAHLLPCARVLLRRLPVLFGVAVVENAFDRVCDIEAVAPAHFEEADRRLLARTRALLPSIPFDPVDVLVVCRMGKNISGAGMDPNVIGMYRRLGGVPDRSIERIVVLDLTAESHGNAIGVGMADVTTERLARAIDWAATRANGLTSTFFGGIKLPVALPSDRDAIAAAARGFPPDRIRLAVIEDTAHLDRMYVSAALAREGAGRERLRVSTEATPMEFSPAGELLRPHFRSS